MGKSTSKIAMIIGLIAVALFYAIGFLYSLRGNIYLTGTLALIPVVAYVFLAQQMEQKKKDPEGKILEVIFSSIYGIIALIFFTFFFHGIDIEFNRKDAIKKSAYDKLGAVDKLLEEYANATDRQVNSFGDKVESAVSAYFLNFSMDKKTKINDLLGEGSIDFKKSKAAIEKQAKAAIEAKQEVIRNGFDLSSVIEEWTDYQERIRPDIDNWNRLNISFVYYDIDNMYKKVYDEAMLKMPSFDYTEKLRGIDIALDKPFTALFNGLGLAFILLLFYGAMHFCILMSYFFSKRPEIEIIRSGDKKNSYGSNHIKM